MIRYGWDDICNYLKRIILHPNLKFINSLLELVAQKEYNIIMVYKCYVFFLYDSMRKHIKKYIFCC